MYKKIFSLLLIMNYNIADVDNSHDINNIGDVLETRGNGKLVISDSISPDEKLFLQNLNCWFLADYFELGYNFLNVIIGVIFSYGVLIERSEFDQATIIFLVLCIINSFGSIFLNFTDFKYSYKYLLKNASICLFTIIDDYSLWSICCSYLLGDFLLVFLSKKKYKKKMPYIEALKNINPDKYKNLKV